jgi:drug/metabolite transporter (DMT)-like permease
MVALGASFWGTDGVIRRPLIDDGISSTAIVFGEHLFLLLFSVPVLIMARGFFGRLNGKQWLALLAIAWGASGLATVLFTEAFARGNPTTVILLQKTQPIIAVLLAGVLLRERLPRLYWPCFGVALVGAYLVSFGTLDPIWDLSNNELAAAGLAVGAAALWGGGTVFGRYMLADVDFSTLTAARFFFAVPFLFGLAIWRGDVGATFDGINAHPERMFLLALIPGLLSMLFYYWGLQRTRASYATLAELSFPATALILNWIFLDATITATQAFGFILLWGSIAALTWLPALRRGTARRAAEVTAGTS